MKKMTLLEKHASHQRRVRNRMIRTVARKLWQEDLRRTGRLPDYEYATDTEVARIVDGLLADKEVAHINIPARAFHIYCNGDGKQS